MVSIGNIVKNCNVLIEGKISSMLGEVFFDMENGRVISEEEMWAELDAI